MSDKASSIFVSTKAQNPQTRNPIFAKLNCLELHCFTKQRIVSPLSALIYQNIANCQGDYKYTSKQIAEYYSRSVSGRSVQFLITENQVTKIIDRLHKAGIIRKQTISLIDRGSVRVCSLTPEMIKARNFGGKTYSVSDDHFNIRYCGESILSNLIYGHIVMMQKEAIRTSQDQAELLDKLTSIKINTAKLARETGASTKGIRTAINRMDGISIARFNVGSERVYMTWGILELNSSIINKELDRKNGL